MTHHVLETPVSEAQVRALKVGDTVTLEKTLFGVRDANLIAMFDRDRKTIFDLHGHAVIHTAPNVRKVPVTNENPAGYEPLCVGTTTSQRMERFTRPLMTREGVRIIIGKGGRARSMPSASSAAPISRWSAARPRCRPPGSRGSRRSTWTTSIPRVSGASASKASARCW